MTTNELRLGNYLWWDYLGDNVIVTSIDTLQISLDRSERAMIDIEELKPIPLTEEWLLTFGFEQQTWAGLKTDSYEKGIYQLSKVGGEHTMYQLSSNHLMLVVFPESVHQLQNLYFALTGTELTIKE
jgi:hypothetical protein